MWFFFFSLAVFFGGSVAEASLLNPVCTLSENLELSIAEGIARIEEAFGQLKGTQQESLSALDQIKLIHLRSKTDKEREVLEKTVDSTLRRISEFAVSTTDINLTKTALEALVAFGAQHGTYFNSNIYRIFEPILSNPQKYSLDVREAVAQVSMSSALITWGDSLMVLVLDDPSLSLGVRKRALGGAYRYMQGDSETDRNLVSALENILAREGESESFKKKAKSVLEFYRKRLAENEAYSAELPREEPEPLFSTHRFPNGDVLLLLTPEELNGLKPDTRVETVTGEVKVIGKDKIYADDTRHGYTAYGFRQKANQTSKN